MKKIGFILLSLTAIFSGYFFLPSSHSLDHECAFCNPQILNNQKFYEDEYVLGLYTHKPIQPGHCLVIPKAHRERFEMLTEEEIQAIAKAIKKINQAVSKVFGTNSYLLLQKNGAEVGQTVPHVHFHYIPRQPGEQSNIKFLFQFYMANFKKPIEPAEMQEMVDKIKEALSE